MTDEVAALVLEDNRLQALALSIAETRRRARRCRACPADRDVREHPASSTARSRGSRQRRACPARAGGHGPDPARTRGAAVDHQARAAGRDRGERRSAHDPASSRSARRLPGRRCEAVRAAAIDHHRLRSEIVATSLANRSSTAWAWSTRSSWPRRKAPALGQVCRGVRRRRAAVRARRGLARDRDRADARNRAHRAVRAGRARAAQPHGRPAARRRRAGRRRRDSSPKLGTGVAELDRSTSTTCSKPKPATMRERIAARAGRHGRADRAARMVARLFEIDGAIGLAAPRRATAASPPTVLARALRRSRRSGSGSTGRSRRPR